MNIVLDHLVSFFNIVEELGEQLDGEAQLKEKRLLGCIWSCRALSRHRLLYEVD